MSNGVTNLHCQHLEFGDVFMWKGQEYIMADERVRPYGDGSYGASVQDSDRNVSLMQWDEDEDQMVVLLRKDGFQTGKEGAPPLPEEREDVPPAEGGAYKEAPVPEVKTNSDISGEFVEKLTNLLKELPPEKRLVAACHAIATVQRSYPEAGDLALAAIKSTTAVERLLG